MKSCGIGEKAHKVQRLLQLLPAGEPFKRGDLTREGGTTGQFGETRQQPTTEAFIDLTKPEERAKSLKAEITTNYLYITGRNPCKPRREG